MYICSYRYISDAAGQHASRWLAVLMLMLCTACTHSGTRNGEDFAFEYRGLYTPSNADEKSMRLYTANNPDYDWGLWGHNLRKLFNGKLPEEVQALVDGRRNPAQICFSSKRLYHTLEQYIADETGENEGEWEPQRFTLMPDDNTLVCTCPACTEAGNNRQTATPAVTRLVERLAARFPKHLFFTSSYLTTQEPPARKLPDNAGVIISVIDLPLQAERTESKETARLKSRMEAWEKVTSRIYVWDYIRNFDDYLTPYPCLRLMQERLRRYREWGVKGVFLNGSGNDYASLDDLQTYVLARLLADPDCNVEECVRHYLRRNYPVTGGILASHYLQWEENAATRGRRLPLHGGIREAVNAWLEPDSFRHFLDEISQKVQETDKNERARLHRLLTALPFSRLELMRLPQAEWDARQAAECLARLERHRTFADMACYREAEGSLDTYINAWRHLLAENAAAPDRLARTTLKACTPLDEDYPDPALLTDGRYALPTDYHTGWLIVSARETVLEIPAGKLPAEAVLEFSLLEASRWRIHLPERIEVTQGDGKPLGVALPPANAATDTKHKVKCRVSGVDTRLPVQIRITQGEGHERPTLALDEIDAF